MLNILKHHDFIPRPVSGLLTSHAITKWLLTHVSLIRNFLIWKLKEYEKLVQVLPHTSCVQKVHKHKKNHQPGLYIKVEELTTAP